MSELNGPSRQHSAVLRLVEPGLPNVGGRCDDVLVTTSTSPSMIGRGTDLDVLRDEFRASLGVQPRAVVVAGEAGIGKTRLISEFVSSIRDEATVLTGQCFDLGADSSPYSPFTAVMRGLMVSLGDGNVGRDRLLDAAGAGRAVLSVLIPELAASADLPERSGAERLYELVAILLEAFSKERPLVIVLEDIHWADTATLELTRFLVRMLAASRVLMVMSYRSDEVPRGHPLRAQLPELERTRRLTRVDLKRLTRAEVREQVCDITGEAVESASIDRIYARSEGVPFFVEELVCERADGADTLPDTLRELLLARYERLTEPTQRVLRMISAAGICVEHPLLSTVFDGPADELDAAAREAIAANILTVDGAEYCFRHALVREAIHNDLLPGERVRFHSRFAAALEADDSSSASTRSEASYHWMMAHDLVRAFPATLDAMHAAEDAFAYSAAAHMGERALELWDQIPDAEERAGFDHVELLRRCSRALRGAGEGERALAVIDAALAECPRERSDVYARLLHNKALHLALLSGPGSTELMEEALALVVDDPESAIRTRLLSELSGRLMLEAEFGRAIQTATVALDAATSRADTERMSVSHNIRGVSLVGSGQIDAGLEDLRIASELAEHDDSAMLRYRVNMSDVYFLIGCYDDAISIGEAGERRARELGVQRTTGAMMSSNTVEALLAVGRWKQAEAYLEPALDIDAPPGIRVHLRRMKLWLSVWKGDTRTAADLLRRWHGAMKLQSQIEMQSRLGAARVETEIALAHDDLDSAWRAASVILSDDHRVMSGYDLPLLADAARVLAGLRSAGRPIPGTANSGAAPADSVRELADAEVALRGVLEHSRDWPTASAWIPLFEAELSGDDGQGSSAAAWREAVDAASGPGAQAYLLPYTLYRLAGALLSTGERREAEDAASIAREKAAALGAGLIVGWVDELATKAGFGANGSVNGTAVGRAASAATVELAGGARLTERESQVLALLGRGLSNRQIGAELFISAKTASVHVSAILRKLGATSRTEAVYRARELGVAMQTAG